MIAFLLILGVSFYFIVTSLGKLVGDYLLDTRVDQETAYVQKLAERFAPNFYKGDAESLYRDARQSVDAKSVIILLDMDGKVQVDTKSKYNGLRFRHPEVLSALRGLPIDYGFHRVTMNSSIEKAAIFDFLREMQMDKAWVCYFATPLMYNQEQIGVLLYVVDVVDLDTAHRIIQDQMILYFIATSIVVILLSIFFSSIITKPIAALTEGIKQMAKGDLSGRVKESGSDEMARLAQTFNQMSEKLENLDNARNEFVSNASHELKTPLATMKIMLESMMYEENMDEKLRKEFMADIDKELERLGHIVSDLLTLVRIDSSDYQLRRTSLVFREIVEDTMRRLEPLAEAKEQRLQLHLLSDCPLLGDMTKLQQAVYNLVENAIKYSPEKGRIDVTLKQEGKMAVFVVNDSGPGIPKKDQPHIFDRFYRVDRARSRATGGNGLGLSIVQQAIHLHEGKVSVMSEEGKGATFRVELPL